MNRVESERIWLNCAVRGPGWPYACPDATERDDQGGERRRRVALEAPRRAHAGQLAQEQPEVEPADVNEQTLENVGVSTQVHAAHPARLVEMRVGAFEPLAALPQQPLPARATDPSAVGRHGLLGRRLALPVAPPAIRFRYVTAHAHLGELDQRLIAVVPLVGDDFGEPGGRDHRQVVGGHREGLDQGGGVALVRVLHRDAHDGPGLQVHRVLGLVCEMRAAVLHLGDLGVRIMRVRPVVVRPFLLPLPIEPGQLGAGRRCDAGGLRQPGQPGVVGLAGLPPHDAPHRRVGFQRRRIDADRVPLDELRVGQPLQHPREHRLVRLEVDQATGPRQRRVIRRRLGQRQIQKRADTQRIGRAPRDRPLRVQPFEIAQQQQAKIPPRGQTRPADRRRIERRALRLDEGVEARLVEHPVQSRVKGVPCTRRQIPRRDPHRRLPGVLPSCTHRHIRECSTRDRSCRSLITKDFHHGLLGKTAIPLGDRYGLATFGVIVAALGSYAIATATPPVGRDPEGVITTAGNMDVFRINLGDCFNDEVQMSSDGLRSVSRVAGIPCSGPHDNEVYAIFDSNLSNFPGDEEMSESAEEQCVELFESFVRSSYEESVLYSSHLFPTSESWTQRGDREIVCYLYEPDKKLLGSEKGSGR